jgi:hypothetical protein
MILAIDPGPTESAWVLWDGSVVDKATVPNLDLLCHIRLDDFGNNRLAHGLCHLVVEKVESFGMAVGVSVFETVYWTGRFIEAWASWGSTEANHSRIGRKAVKLHLCQTHRAKDANIRQAILDRFGSEKSVAIGKKANPGPLYGVVKHEWSAIALAITYEETRDQR